MSESNEPSGDRLNQRRLLLRLDPEGDHPQRRARLEVRWNVEPDTLAKDAVDYLVEVRTEQDVLAEKTVSHTGKSLQKAVFTQDDFENLDESDVFEPQAVIRALSEPSCETATESFILGFGQPDDQPVKSSAGKIYPTLVLAAAHVVPQDHDLKALVRWLDDPGVFSRDKKGFMTCRWRHKVGRVYCPPLLSALAEDWQERHGALGRWRVRVRADGVPVGQAEFIAPEVNPAAERLIQASRKMVEYLKKRPGPLGILYDDSEVLNRYVLAAHEVWKTSAPELTLIQTLEVVSLAGHCLGLIVLPTHPLRVAWQQSFDLLVAYHRLEGESPAKIQRLLATVTSAHHPAFLPGLQPGEAFVFADTLGFHAVALTPAGDPEPKATVALMARLLGDEDNAAPTVGKGAVTVLADEISRYLHLHPDYRRIQVHALRAGDAMPVVRALGKALPGGSEEPADLGEDEVPSRHDEQDVCYELDLYPAEGQATELTGRFLSATVERRRSGAGSVPDGDRWIMASARRPGGVNLPRLRWARRDSPVPKRPAHLALTFDVFTSRIAYRPLASLPPGGVLEAHGLALMPTRSFQPDPTPHWLSFIPANPDGEKHPTTRVLTTRQVGLHSVIQQAVVRHLGGGPEDWPVLVTEVNADRADLLKNLHELCDWVITADRNAGLEYFDSPRDLPLVYDAYIIDCVPERDDLGFLQLITSTSSFDEVRQLLDGALNEMGLSSSERNCQFLLGALKAVSGRLALRLAGRGHTPQEMIAVALVHRHCAQASETDKVWLPLAEGFFIPLDDVPELFREPGKTPAGSEQRADLLYISAPKRSGLRITFIEVKFRRYLKTARAPDLAETMERQIDASCQGWEQLFGPKTSALEKTVNRAWLARILRFYARKGRRHTLSEDAFQRALREIDRMVKKEIDLPTLGELQRFGFVFCPEYHGRQPVEIGQDGEAQLWLFGPGILPESPISLNLLEIPSSPLLDPSTTHPPSATEDRGEGGMETPETQNTATPAREAEILLGHREGGDEPVIWRASIKANPHLMILGQPGMGKTTCLINLCLQLTDRAITPIVFSYHQDIDEKLAARLADPPLTVRYAGLGFNPLQVDGNAPLAYLDNIGMLRDIFAAIFPELGDVQLGRLREALKQSYRDQGWETGQRGATPSFRAFLDLLRADAKPDRGLLTLLNRFSELDDYGLFEAGGALPSLLDQTRPALIEIHGTQNDYLQRAFATFVLYNLYQNMFRRGPQPRITHAVIFDEAHRAARLKLIPSMVKECRKYGIAFVVASQEAKDFDPSLFTAVAHYLTLRLSETDAKFMAKNFAAADKVALYADRMKQMPKYRALYYGEGLRAPVTVGLLADDALPGKKAIPQ
ncbi:MAG: ATP-binding protein [Candidatus Competibacteraceae bacterium]|nr:MAG: ATP-binding protein [Candidatus Competibacteraceae bacterium]